MDFSDAAGGRPTDLRSANSARREDDLLVRGEVVELLIGTARILDAVDDRSVTISTGLENLHDLCIDENVEVAPRQCRLDVVPRRVRPRTILNLFPI